MCCCAAGKVHGSLARAGKVRSQTPKVAKAEKKKVPKGRAFQRLKYNRRFVNVGEWGAACAPQPQCALLRSCTVRRQLQMQALWHAAAL